MKDFFSHIDFESLSTRSKEKISKIFHDLSTYSKERTLLWIEQVQSIKSDPQLSLTQKYLKLEQLNTADVVLSLLKSVLTVVIEEIPIKNKEYLMTGLIGAGTVFAVMRFQLSLVTMAVAQKSLPGFLLSPPSDKVLEYLRDQLSKEISQVSS